MFPEIIGPFRTRKNEDCEPTRDENNKSIFGLIGRLSLDQASTGPCRPGFSSSRPKTPVLYPRSLFTNHQGPGRKLGRP